MAGNYTRTLATAKTDPKTAPIDYKSQGPFIRELVASKVVQDVMLEAEIDSSRSFYNG